MHLSAKIFAAKNGTVAVLMGFLLVPLIGMVGLSVDAIRLFSTHADLQQALEIAMNAGVRGKTEQEAIALMRSYFEINWQAAGHQIVQDGSLSVDINQSEDNTALLGLAKYQMPTIFLRMVGVPQVAIKASVTVTLRPRTGESR